VKSKNLSLLFILLSSNISLAIAQDEKKPSLERGIYFGEKPKEKKTKLKQKTEKELLMELVEIAKQQLKEQKRIREILENEFDPKPKEITLEDGTKCIENSSDKCFSMPIIPEIRGIPAIANFYKNPTKENAKIKELWMAKYTSRILDGAYISNQAIREMGDKYPLARMQTGSYDKAGAYNVALKRYKKEIVNKFADRIIVDIFFGKNRGLDAFSMLKLIEFIEENPKLKMNFIFFDKKSQLWFEKQASNFTRGKVLLTKEYFIDSDSFKKYHIYNTPAILIEDHINKKTSLINIGAINSYIFYDKVIQYLIHNKIIKRNEFRADKVWGSEAAKDYMNTYYKHIIGVKYEK